MVLSQQALEKLVADIDDAVDEASRWDGQSVIVTHDLLLRVHAVVRLLARHVGVVRLVESQAIDAGDGAATEDDEGDDEAMGSSGSILDGDGQFGCERAAWERHYLERLLERNGGNVSRAAREAGLDRRTLYRFMLKRGVKPQRFASGGG